MKSELPVTGYQLPVGIKNEVSSYQLTVSGWKREKRFPVAGVDEK